MKTTLALVAALVVPSLALAHVSVRPRESKPGVEERYTVRVPTEGAVTTISVHLEIPDGVTVMDIERYAGETFETQKSGDRIVGITWKKDIKPKDTAELFFRARNPVSGAELAWKAHQHFADGSVADWVEAAGGKRPASVTKLTAADATQSPASDAVSVESWLQGYDAAFMARDLAKLATFYHPDVTIYEGGGVNNGWADYRDNHLGPELKAFQDLQFAHSNTRVTVMAGGESAYATSRYLIKAKMGERVIDSEGLETLLLVKSQDGRSGIHIRRAARRGGLNRTR
jgi:uncharacterized protein YcnI